MTTTPHTYQRPPHLFLAFAAVASLLAAATAALFALTVPRTPAQPVRSLQTYGDNGFEVGYEGFAGQVPDSKKPKLTAYFTSESYRPGTVGHLVIRDTAPAVELRFYRAGGENRPTTPNDVMLGTPVGAAQAIGSVHGTRTLDLRLGNWPSGVYFAQLTSGPRIGYATFVVAPRRLGEHKVAVVMPTMTWQAYNFRDDDRDGIGDTWYSGYHINKARLIRPFLDRGVPPHWKYYDAPFLRWLAYTRRQVDVLSDAELRNVSSGRALAKAYSLIVFSGHHEYVTTHEYDVVSHYRDLGGHLMFLSANNFFWKVDLHGAVMTRVAQWRHLGRPEAALIGVQYVANDNGEHRGRWLVRETAATPWLFAGTEIAKGNSVGNGGIEIDQTAPSSPKGVHLIAEIPNLFGPGFTAQMTYYETPAGAKVFAAGAFTLAGSVWQPDVEALVVNLWTRLSVA